MSEDKVVYKDRKGSKKTSGKRPKSNRNRPLNRYELETPDDLKVSTSSKKLKLSEDLYDVEVDDSFGYRILNFIAVFSAISNVVVCKECKSDVTFTESGKRGLGFKVVVFCKNCDKKEIPSCPYVDKGYEINRRIVLAMRLLGVGLHGIIKFCGIMELPRPVFQSFYDKIVNNIHKATEIVCNNSISNAAKEEKSLSIEKGETNGISVSGDGTWRKRGFTSLFGLVTLIGYNIGKIVDYIVKSKYCKACEYWEKKTDTEEYAEWAKSHASECGANHEGSAGKMEVDGVIEMFQRSETLHDLKYENYIGDGDSKTFKGVTEAKPYGEEFTIKKKECIDHVQKRIGSRLRNLKKLTKGLGGKGKLTGKLIDELSIYYGLAIRRNSDSIEKMRNEIWATLDHKLSTDAKPQHDRCPPGEESWCSWQRSKATNNLEEYVHKPPLHPEVFKAIKPIYEELSNDDLLTRCIGGYTQNNNESFNATVWALAPKSIQSGKVVLETATNIAIGIYNDGFASILQILATMGMKIGRCTFNMCCEIDAKRISKAENSLTDAAKEARTNSKSSRKERQEEDEHLEGQLYGAGIAD